MWREAREEKNGKTFCCSKTNLPSKFLWSTCLLGLISKCSGNRGIALFSEMFSQAKVRAQPHWLSSQERAWSLGVRWNVFVYRIQHVLRFKSPSPPPVEITEQAVYFQCLFVTLPRQPSLTPLPEPQHGGADENRAYSTNPYFTQPKEPEFKGFV